MIWIPRSYMLPYDVTTCNNTIAVSRCRRATPWPSTAVSSSSRGVHRPVPPTAAATPASIWISSSVWQSASLCSWSSSSSSSSSSSAWWGRGGESVRSRMRTVSTTTICERAIGTTTTTTTSQIPREPAPRAPARHAAFSSAANTSPTNRKKASLSTSTDHVIRDVTVRLDFRRLLRLFAYRSCNCMFGMDLWVPASINMSINNHYAPSLFLRVVHDRRLFAWRHRNAGCKDARNGKWSNMSEI